MAAGSFDPSQVRAVYGTTGEDVALKMNKIAEDNGYHLVYDSKMRRFTVLGSHDKTTKEIQKLFSSCAGSSWSPKVLTKVDELGNRLVKLDCKIDPMTIDFLGEPKE